MKVLVVIPARGGSKGIPRKNLRSLAGRPLLTYSIECAKASVYHPDIYVSTEDAEIASVARKMEVAVIERDPGRASDDTTLDPVIHDAFVRASTETGLEYDVVVTLQPTSPLLKTGSLDLALARLERDATLDTVISAKNDTHLSWRYEAGTYKPNYTERVNRQYLTPVFRETGGFLIARNRWVGADSRIGEKVDLYLLEGAESIDIDTYEDWSLCEFHLARKTVLFVVSGFKEIGLGHVYNSLLLANDILNHRVRFLVDTESQLAFDVIAAKNYDVVMQERPDILEDIKALKPDVVINDRLDNGRGYIRSLKEFGATVINFEDLGPGAALADLVINAIYPEKEVLPKHYFGHDYFVLRDEFILSNPRPLADRVERVLLTFGGTDSNNYTLKVIEAVHEYCARHSIQIHVVAGLGYSRFDSLAEFGGVIVHHNTVSIADHIRSADIVFTSAGRTTYEVASLRVPSIVLAQNERELTHFFASSEYGFLNLGLGTEVSGKEILEAFHTLVENRSDREVMADLMGKVKLAEGRRRVTRLIKETMEKR